MSYLALARAFFSDRITLFERMGREVGEIGRVEIGPRSIVLVNSPETVQEVLIDRVDDFIKGPGLRIWARQLLGDGLLTSEGERHRRQRRLVAPAFAHQRVSRYGPVMVTRTRSAMARWKPGATLDIAQEMMRLTLGIAGETLFDADLLAEADTLGADITTLQRWAMFLAKLPFRLPITRGRRMAHERLDGAVYGMIRARRESGEDRGDLLSMLLLSKDQDTGEYLTDLEVRDEAMTLFVAGHETTAQALSWAWYLLGRNPTVLARMRAEPNYSLLVLKEVMRLYPPAYILGRTAVEDTTIRGFGIRKDELVLIAPWLIHRNPAYFSEPTEFDPERFRPEREARMPKFAYFPFGGGKRVCIGNQFALMEGQLVLDTIAQQFTFQAVGRGEIRTEALMTLRPRGGIRMSVLRN